MSDQDIVEDAKWVEIQKKTFTRWANTFLKERIMKIDDVKTDLANGVMLINLLEIISSKNLGKFNKQPKIKTQMLENNLVALNFLRTEGIKLVNIGPEDIHDQKLKLILGLIWTIILRYQIHIEEGKSARNDLLEWVRKQIPEYNIKNFDKDWNDGRAICALVDSLKPGLCPNHRSLDPRSAFSNASLGEDLAEKDMGIPKVLDPRDMVDPSVDELSVMTYISYFRDWQNNESKRRNDLEKERTAVPEWCRAYGPGLEHAETFVPAPFTIEAINQLRKRKPVGGDNFVVTIRGPNTAVDTDHLIYNNDGTYSVQYTPIEPGKHTIQITLHDKNISNSPFRVNVVRSPPDPMKCRAYGPGLEPGNQLGAPAKFTIEACNKFGDPMKDGGDPFQVKVDGPYNIDVQTNIVDNKNGTYSVTYYPVDQGDHLVKVTLNGAPIQGSPWRVQIEGSDSDADPSNTIAYGPGLEKGNTSEPAEFTIETRNKHGKKVTTPAPVDVEIQDEEGKELTGIRIADNRDGTYKVTYQAINSGIHTIDVVLRHKLFPIYYFHIKDSPFKARIDQVQMLETALLMVLA